MIYNIKGTRAYDLSGNEVDNLNEAWILFVDTEEAAIKLRVMEHEKYFSNVIGLIGRGDYIFEDEEPNIYICSTEFDGSNAAWTEISEYRSQAKEYISFYNQVESIVKKEVQK